ncbi:MAG TPA: hypothetical protein VGB82_13060 [Alphaproteobacteria bacterium]
MKAFLAGAIVAILIGTVAGLILHSVNESATTAFSTSSARVSTN